MWTPFRLFVCAALVVGVVGCSAPAPEPEPEPETPAKVTEEQIAIATQFGVAETEDGRIAMLEAHPWLSEPIGRRAIQDAASAQTVDLNAVMSERIYRSLQWLGERNNDDLAQINALSGLALVEGSLRGNLLGTLQYSEQALAFAEHAGEVRATLSPLMSLGIVHRRLGNYDLALEYFGRTMTVAEAEQQVGTIARVLNNLGTLHYSLGNLSLAREYFDRSIDIKLTLDDGAAGTRDLANSLANVGVLYVNVGDSRHALTYLERAAALFEQAGRGASVLFALGHLTRAHIALADLEEAERTVERAAKLAEDGDRTIIAEILFLRGVISRERGALNEALTYLQRSLAMRKENRDVPPLVESHVELGQLWLRLGRPKDAEAEARTAIAIAAPARLLSQLATAQFHLAKALEAQGRGRDAVAAYEEAVRAVERLRDRALEDSAARQVFMRQRLGPFTGLASLHARAGRAWDAMQTMEQARARALLEIVTSGPVPPPASSEDVRRREREVMQTLAARTRQLRVAEDAPGAAPATLEARRRELQQARQAYDDFRRDVFEAHPELRLKRGEPSLITRVALKDLIPDGTAAVQFVSDPEEVWAYLVRPGVNGPTVSAHKLDMASGALTALGARFAEQVGARDLGFAGTAKELYLALFADIDVRLQGVSRLIVIPDSTLWNVPFQALITPRGRYLVEERAVSYAPSLSALAALRARAQARPVRAVTLVALGDPSDDGTTVARVRNATTGTLPETRREVGALTGLYGEARSTVLVGADASEAALRRAASGATVLHIASHGVLDDQAPMYSHLRLTPDRDNDGRLEAWELAELDLSADLVVLSACETARGAVGGGEGVIGLSWALLAAGASTAVLSQWEVDSASTTDLMIAFHKRLLATSPTLKAAPNATPDALRQAQVAMLGDARYRHPFYWAGFIVMGS